MKQTTEELQYFITEWNFLHSPSSFNVMTKDMMRGRLGRKGAVVDINTKTNLTPLQAFELKKERSERDEEKT